uniref:Protein kinase domain-containing protein n=1 Tax=Alexandrium monilatum TaxID=311494 RepID=A0A7S4RYG1_9DINO
MGNASSVDEESFHSRYSLGKQLGKGAQGRVHVCFHKPSNVSYAVKMIDRTVKTSWTTYRREVELCRSACSENVVSVFADFADSDYCYIVMERFEGHLRKGLKWVAREEAGRAGGLGDGSLCHVVCQVLQGIRHLHGCGIVHRDVKSHNVFIDRIDVRDPRCRVVLGDLGLARRLERGRFLCAQVGTRKYWAPELYDKRYSHVVDVFALGVLFFLMVSSQYPFFDEQQTRQRDVFAERLLPGSLSPSALGVLRTMLEKDPSRRPPAAELAAHPWLLPGRGDRAAAAEAESRRAGPTRRGGPGRRAEATQKPLPPQVCLRWESCQVARVRGDASAELDEDSTDPEGGPRREESEMDSATLKRERSRRTRSSACEDRTPSTPTTATFDTSLATISPSTTKSAGLDSERRCASPSADPPDLDNTVEEDAHSSEGAAARHWDRAGAAGGPRGGCAAPAGGGGDRGHEARGGRRSPAPEIESL